MKKALLALGTVALSAVLLAVALIGANQHTADEAQAAVAPFYETPANLPSTPGTLIRTEPLGVVVPGAMTYRMLYSSQRPDGSIAVSSGMLFVPTAPAPAGGRPIVAWAHGTIGQGDSCAPSRPGNSLNDTANWLNQMISLGWVVTATDYTGLGTAGPNLYLVAKAEVSDVVNSVRAARQLPGIKASNRYVVWGHSQGGHSSLWSGHLAPKLAPELKLLGVAAAAPAANLNLIVGAQWSGLIGWGIGPEVADSWPLVNPALTLPGVVSQAGINNVDSIAQECLSSNKLLVQLLVRKALGQSFFEVNPINNPLWKAMGERETPPPLPASMPVFVGQSTADEVVLAWPNAVLQNQWCKAGSTISTLWVGEVSHQLTAETIGPDVVRWINDRFAGRPALRTCDLAPPVSPPVNSPAGS